MSLAPATSQSLESEALEHEDAVRAADLKLLIEQRRHYLGIANALAERLGIPVCADCGKRRDK